MRIVRICILAWSVTIYHHVTAASPFERAASSATFVDKTQLISDLLTEQTRFYILTCPRGFGKSTNHDMLKRFFEMTTDPAGQPIPTNQTDNYKLFTNASLGFRIADHANIMEKHFGQYMIIALDFRIRNATTYQQIIDELHREIRRLYDDYRWLYDTYLAHQLISFSFTRKIFKRIYADQPIESDIKNSVREVARMVQYYLKRPVYLLIDNYDTPTWTALHHGADGYRMHSLIRALITAAIKETPVHIAGAVFAGTSGLVLNSTTLDYGEFDDLKSLKLLPFLNGSVYDRYFGFTEAEVVELLGRSAIASSEITQIQRLHGVYNAKNGKFRMYNTSSILAYVNRQSSDYAQNILTLTDCLQHRYQRSIIQELILSKKIHIFYQADIATESDFKILENMLTPAARCVECNTRIYISYLYEIGYLTNEDKKYLSVASSRHQSELENYLSQYYIRFARVDETTLKTIAYSFQSILDQLSTSDETQREFKNCLQHQSVLAYLNDDSQPYGYITRKPDFFALVYTAAVIYGRHLYGNINANVAVRQSPSKMVDNLVGVDVVDIVVSSKTQPIVLFVQISSGELIKRTVEYVTRYVPKGDHDQPKYLKYLAISARKGKVDVAFPPTVQYVDGQWQILETV